MNRERKDGYAVTDRAAGIADLLHMIVVKLDSGTSTEDLAPSVLAIAKAMQR